MCDLLAQIPNHTNQSLKMCANFTEGKERETGTTLAAKNQVGPVDRELGVLILLQGLQEETVCLSL